MLINIGLNTPLKKASYNYIGLDTCYYSTDNTNDPFGIKAKGIYPWGTIIQFYEAKDGTNKPKMVQIYVPDLYGQGGTAIYIRSIWIGSNTSIRNWLKDGSKWRKINLSDL